MIRILIVEDMILLQESLANIVNGQEDMEVAGVTANADEALILCRETSPDLALIDVVTEGKGNGIAAAAEIRRKMPNIKIVIMTALPEITFIDAARKAGAHSFVYKSSDCQHLLYVIRCTMKNNGIYPGPGDKAITEIDDLAESLDTNSAVQNGVNLSAFYEFKRNVKNLSRTEGAIFNFYMEGYSATQAAEKFFVSLNTIKSHNRNIYRKLNVSSLKELRVYTQMMKASD